MTRDLEGGEQPFAGTPFVAQGEAVPAPPALFAGPFRRIVLANLFGSLAFWAFYGAVFWEAANRYGAEQAGMAVLGAALSVPFILGSLIQGLAVDRWSPKWLLVIGYLMLIAAIPLALVGNGLPWLWGSSFLVGAAFATIEPSRSALTALYVEPGRLVPANGAIATSFQAALVVGSLGGGWLLDAWGPDAVYTLAFAAALLPVLVLLGAPDRRQRGERPSVSLGDLRTGGATAWRLPSLRVLLVLTTAAWMLINVFFILEPLYVKDVLGRGDAALLYLWAAHGAGALVGAIAVTRARRLGGKEAMLVCAGVTLVGAGIFAYTAAGVYGFALVASAVSGVGFALFFPPLLALIQRVVPEDQRGRVTGVFVALQESAGLASSIVVLVLGSVVVVRPTLVLAGALVAVMGVGGLRAEAALRRREEAAERASG
ncbi:MAG: MFS transporter [Planctomycetaceae bacterium]